MRFKPLSFFVLCIVVVAAAPEPVCFYRLNTMRSWIYPIYVQAVDARGDWKRKPADWKREVN